MSDQLERIAAALKLHQFSLVNHSSIGPNHHCGCGFRPQHWLEWAEHAAQAALDALHGDNSPREQMNREECLVARDGSVIWRNGVKYFPAVSPWSAVAETQQENPALDSRGHT